MSAITEINLGTIANETAHNKPAYDVPSAIDTSFSSITS